MSDDLRETLRPSRRILLAAGAPPHRAALGLVGRAQAQGAAPPGPSVPADTGAVQGERVVFPNWRDSGDAPPPPPPAPMPPGERVGFAVVGLGRLSLEEILPAFGAAKEGEGRGGDVGLAREGTAHRAPVRHPRGWRCTVYDQWDG